MEGDLKLDLEMLQRSLMAALQEADQRTDLYPAQTATKFPRILARLVELWGKPEFDDYVQNDLLTTDRPNRQGFPPEVALELFRLSNYHAAKLGLTAPESAKNPWDLAADAEYFKKEIS